MYRVECNEKILEDFWILVFRFFWWGSEVVHVLTSSASSSKESDLGSFNQKCELSVFIWAATISWLKEHLLPTVFFFFFFSFFRQIKSNIQWLHLFKGEDLLLFCVIYDRIWWYFFFVCFGLLVGKNWWNQDITLALGNCDELPTPPFFFYIFNRLNQSFLNLKITPENEKSAVVHPNWTWITSVWPTQEMKMMTFVNL